MLRAVESIKRFFVHSTWTVEHLRRKQIGALYRWVKVVPDSVSHNIVTDEGINSTLNIMFHGATQIATWYVLIFDTNTTCTAAMTYAVPVFTESTAYDEANRPAFVESESTAKTLTNSASKAVFTMNATVDIYGGALVGGGSSPSGKGDVGGGGTLFCASKFDALKAANNDDIINVTVTISDASV
jgi:hypothetical protein